MPTQRATRFWHELTTDEFAALDKARAIAILPVAATEQHGPHMTVAVDTVIGEEMLRLALSRLVEGPPILILPTQTVGKSNEHISSPGTLSYSAETLIRMWTEIGESVARAGIAKLLIVSSHGGNSEVMGIVARDLRVRLGMLVVTTAWMRFGLPGAYSEMERLHDIHAGDVETSLMLHFRPDMVRMHKAENFVPASLEMENSFTHLRFTGPSAAAWIAQDVHPSGAVGNAAAASAEKGRQIAELQASAFVALVGDIDRFDLARLAGRGT